MEHLARSPCRCAYLHDLVASGFNVLPQPVAFEDTSSATAIYTTHGFGSMYMNVLRGDNLSHLVSMSSNEAALSKALRESDNPELQTFSSQVRCRDVNTTLIRTTEARASCFNSIPTRPPVFSLEQTRRYRRRALWISITPVPGQRFNLGLAQMAK